MMQFARNKPTNLKDPHFINLIDESDMCINKTIENHQKIKLLDGLGA